jgi:hypothetical protein
VNVNLKWLNNKHDTKWHHAIKKHTKHNMNVIMKLYRTNKKKFTCMLWFKPQTFITFRWIKHNESNSLLLVLWSCKCNISRRERKWHMFIMHPFAQPCINSMTWTQHLGQIVCIQRKNQVAFHWLWITWMIVDCWRSQTSFVS